MSSDVWYACCGYGHRPMNFQSDGQVHIFHTLRSYRRWHYPNPQDLLFTSTAMDAVVETCVSFRPHFTYSRYRAHRSDPVATHREIPALCWDQTSIRLHPIFRSFCPDLPTDRNLRRQRNRVSQPHLSASFRSYGPSWRFQRPSRNRYVYSMLSPASANCPNWL